MGIVGKCDHCRSRALLFRDVAILESNDDIDAADTDTDIDPDDRNDGDADDDDEVATTL
jgi:hypothetical protein